MSTDTLATTGKIAGPLPPLPGTGWAREDVWIQDSAGGQWGDYAVGVGASARYTYTLPCGTRRLCVDDDYYIEPYPEDDPAEFTIWNRYEVREERREGSFRDWHEVNTLDDGCDFGSALAWHKLAPAEKEVQRLARYDIRGMLHTHPRF